MLEPLDRSRKDSSLFQSTTKQLRDFIDPNHLLIQIDERPDFDKLVAPFARAVASPPGYFVDWHMAPRRQHTITLSRGAEASLGDGTPHRLGPGDVNLAEDLTGRGHTTRVVSSVPRVTATVRLDE